MLKTPIVSLKTTGNRRGTRSRWRRQKDLHAWDSKLTATSIKVDLAIECRKLPKKDTFSRANGFCGLWEVPPGLQRGGNCNPVEAPATQEKAIGRTEVSRENTNPKFQATFRLEYRFNIEQMYIVRVYDEDLRYASDLKEHDFLGGYVFSLGELFGAQGCAIARPLAKGKSFLILKGTEVAETREVLEFRFAGQGLGLPESKNQLQDLRKEIAKVEVLNKIQKTVDHFHPYFKIERLNSEDQTWKPVWKSEVIKDNKNPCWNVARLPLQLLCGDDPHNPLKITVFDYNTYTDHELAGFVETTVDELVNKARKGIPTFEVRNEKRRILGGIKLEKAGTLKVLKGKVIEIPSMMQYIAGGCKMDLIFALDCTKANHQESGNLHHHTSTYLNDYQAAMLKIANIYDSFEGSNGFTLWGYGGLINGVQQPYFIMGEHLDNSEAVVTTYDAIFDPHNPYFELGENPELRHVIQAAMYQAIRSNIEDHCYTTLCILSTGNISDLEQALDATCSAAEDSPLSIVVIGVGAGPFRSVKSLMGDESGKLRHANGVPVALNIVQFVSFDDYHGSANRCAAAALRDVPEQLVQHFLHMGVRPRPPKPVPDFSKHKFRRRRKRKKPKRRKSVDDESLASF